MENLSQYIDWFRNSSSYINAHRKKVFVVLLTGETIAHENFSNIVHDITLLHSLGVKLVLVHGARPQITDALQRAAIELTYHHGLRITDVDGLHVIKQTVGAMSIDIEALFSMGLANSPMHGADIKVSRGNYITARPLGIIDGVDFALTGKVAASGHEQHSPAVQPGIFAHWRSVQSVCRGSGDRCRHCHARRQTDFVPAPTWRNG